MDVQNEDLYELLGVEVTANASEIKKAYRKRALECHPDKNPDDSKAASRFHALSKALEILGDASARAAYDRVLNAKKAARLRHRELDAKRRKLVDDLERRERLAEANSKLYKTHDDRTDAERLKLEIERLQKEGSELLRREQEKMARHLAETMKTQQNRRPARNRIKARWGGDPRFYDEASLRRFFKKYGDVTELIVLPDKGTALVEFSAGDAAETAIDIEKGLPENPLTLKWADKSRRNEEKGAGGGSPSTISNRDYESLVLMKMRQAAERQKLIDEMSREDGE